jgi:hypothetical protein
MLFANVTRDFLCDILRCIGHAWQIADQRTREEFEEPERHDLFPHQRRAIVEQQLRGVAKRHGFNGSPQKNIRKTSNFSRITCNRVVITASAVQQPSDIVRYAEFRLGFARSNQACLFGDHEPILPNAPLYALVLHGPGAMDIGEDGKPTETTARPGFVDIVFPAPVAGSKNRIEYVGDRINLLAEFPDALTAISKVSTEVVTSKVEPKLRRRSLRKEA